MSQHKIVKIAHFLRFKISKTTISFWQHNGQGKQELTKVISIPYPIVEKLFILPFLERKTKIPYFKNNISFACSRKPKKHQFNKKKNALGLPIKLHNMDTICP